MPRDLRQASQDDLSRLIGGRGWGIPPNRLQGPAESLQLMFGTLLGQSAWLLVDRKGPSPRFFEARRLDGNAWAHGCASPRTVSGSDGQSVNAITIQPADTPPIMKKSRR